MRLQSVLVRVKRLPRPESMSRRRNRSGCLPEVLFHTTDISWLLSRAANLARDLGARCMVRITIRDNRGDSRSGFQVHLAQQRVVMQMPAHDDVPGLGFRPPKG